MEREEHSKTSQVPSLEAEEDNNLPADPLPGDKTNSPVEEIEQSATVPIDEGLTVLNESANGEPESEIGKPKSESNEGGERNRQCWRGDWTD